METRPIDLTKAVEKFGGYSELARRLGVPLSTCHGWKRRKKLPGWRANQIAALAAAENIDVFKRKRRAKRNKRKAA